jgi:hypothetical protein
MGNSNNRYKRLESPSEDIIWLDNKIRFYSIRSELVDFLKLRFKGVNKEWLEEWGI